MSSTESSGAPAEATATNPAPDAAFPSFGSTRGSGLARGKGKRPSAPAATTAASTAYTPTAIEVVTAPREYTNPFAPAETPAAAAPVPPPFEPAPVVIIPAPVRREHVEPVRAPRAPEAPVQAYSAPVEQVRAEHVPANLSDEATAKSELNILEPEQQKHSPAQTWESEGFRPARERNAERPRREESRRDEPQREERTERPAEPFDPASIPEKFLYVRPGHTYVPTPTNFGGAPRERHSAPREAYSAPAASAPAAAPSGGFLGWLKGLFGGSPAETPAPVTADASNGEARREGGEYRRHRGGRNRGGQGGGGGGEGGRGRGRGGRGRSGGGSGGYRSEGSSQGGI